MLQTFDGLPLKRAGCSTLDVNTITTPLAGGLAAWGWCQVFRY
jgi:hypothetical protein